MADPYPYPYPALLNVPDVGPLPLPLPYPYHVGLPAPLLEKESGWMCAWIGGDEDMIWNLLGGEGKRGTTIDSGDGGCDFLSGAPIRNY